MIVLDTNVISEIMRTEPAAHVVRWLDAQPAQSVWTTAVTIFEIQHGLSILPPGRRRDGLQAAFMSLVESDLGNRVLILDKQAAIIAANIGAEHRRTGQNQDLRDTMIAGIVVSNQATLATRNTRHFQSAGIALVNPWKPSGNAAPDS